MIKKITVSVYLILLFLLGAATLIEASRGTDFVTEKIYHAVYFCILWGILTVTSLVLMFRYSLWKRFPAFLMHLSLIVILIGALTTYVDGKKGYIHLRSGAESGYFTLMDHQEKVQLPFTVRLDSFKVEYYPGTQAPKDYISYVTCRSNGDSVSQARISMNKIWVENGYRFYQTSFDTDSKGSYLTVNYDPWGTGITYSGYLLLALSMLGVLLSPRGTFRQLLRSQLKRSASQTSGNHTRMTGNLFSLLFLWVTFSGFSLSAKAERGNGKLPVLKIAQADSLSRLQVIYNDRVTPFNTLARDFVLKIYGEANYKGLSPEQVVGSWLLYPERWKREPIIFIKSKRLRQILGVKKEHAALGDLFEGETYRLQVYYGKGHQKLDQAIWEVDEKVGLISMLLQGTLIKPITADSTVVPLPPAKVEAEMLYNKVPFSKILFMVNLTFGLLGLAYLLHVYLRKEKTGKYDRPVRHILHGVLYAVTAVHLLSYALHGYIAGHLPLSNGYETMLFMALVILLLACFMPRRYPFIVPFGLLLSGFSLLVAYLGQSNPQITPLMPVLLSPWLSSHVSLIMMSYALFAFIMLNGLLALSLMYHDYRHPQNAERHAAQIDQLTVLSQLLLYPATFFLGIGIFLGAVWANESWGRYWAWDPKEVWALITFMVYGAAFHLQSVPAFRNPKIYHIYLVLSFLTVLMTYFGVNYFLVGMHSYA